MIEKKWSFDWGPLTRRENGREEILQDRCRKTPRWFPLVTKFWSVTQGRPLRWCAKFGCQRQPSWGFPTTILRNFLIRSLDSTVKMTRALCILLCIKRRPEKKLQFASSIVKETTGITPVLHVREGEIIQQLKSLIDEEKNINVLVLGANVDEKEKKNGSIINSLITKELTNFRIPIMIVPGNFSKEHISHIT